MPEHNEENRKKLAELVVNNMDFNDLIELATDKQIETYEEDKRIFEQDWDYYDTFHPIGD